jgi:hypothetical protein
MRSLGIVSTAAALAACGGPQRDAASRSGEERCTRPRVALEPGNAAGDASVALDVSPRPGREKISYVGRRLEVRDVGGELLLAIDRSMDPAELPLPTVLRWTRAALPRADLLLRWTGRTHPPGSTERCEVDETKLAVYRDLAPGSAPAMEEVVHRTTGCGSPGFKLTARICHDGEIVRLVRRASTGTRRSERRFDDVTKTFQPPVLVPRPPPAPTP